MKNDKPKRRISIRKVVITVGSIVSLGGLTLAVDWDQDFSTNVEHIYQKGRRAVQIIKAPPDTLRDTLQVHTTAPPETTVILERPMIYVVIDSILTPVDPDTVQGAEGWLRVLYPWLRANGGD